MVYQDPSLGSTASDGGGTTDVAKEQAGRVGQKATEAGGQVAQTTKEQAQHVVGEAKQQARDLVGEARTQVRSQAGSQRDRAVQGLRGISDELDQMAEQGGQSGLATEVARQLSSRTRDLAGHLERNEPSDLLEQVRAYARRRPVVFLAGAALAGVVAGRLTKSLAAGAPDNGSRALTSGYGDGYQPLATGAAPYASTDYPSAGYQTGGGYEAGYPAAADYPTPAYGTGAGTGTGYETGTGYQAGTGYDTGTAGTGYETAPPEYGNAGFREPDAGYRAETDLPPVDDPSYAPPPAAPYESDQPPARGWTP